MAKSIAEQNGKKQIIIPSWMIEVAKGAFYVAVAIGLLYLRISSIENHQKEIDATYIKQEAATALEIGELRNKNAALADMSSALRERISTLEVRGVLSDKSTTESLVRIEKAIDKLQSDVKEIVQPRK